MRDLIDKATEEALDQFPIGHPARAGVKRTVERAFPVIISGIIEDLRWTGSVRHRLVMEPAAAHIEEKYGKKS